MFPVPFLVLVLEEAPARHARTPPFGEGLHRGVVAHPGEEQLVLEGTTLHPDQGPVGLWNVALVLQRVRYVEVL